VSLLSRARGWGGRSSDWAVCHRDVASEGAPTDGGVEGFGTDAAAEINRARLDHLASLDIPLEGRRVLDVGGGVGHLAQFFVKRGCSVVCTDARPENVAEMRRLYPDLDSRVLDVERDDVAAIGQVDVVFCYGLLYHLENPIRVLRTLAGVCSDLMLFETMICDSALPVLRLDDETLSVTQALRGIAHRPSASYLAMALDRIGVPHVYTAVEPPHHDDYRFKPRGDLAVARDGHLLRSVFVASKRALNNDRLTPLVKSR